MSKPLGCAARSRLLRRVQIATCRRVLDLGCGYGAVTGELHARCGGHALGLDRRWEALAAPGWPAGPERVCADAERLPFAADALDLVFCQWTLLWLERPGAVLAEVHRVLRPGGHLVAIEPDFGGLIEHPPEIATGQLWLDGLGRAGADPLVGRKLPALAAAAGFEVRVDLLDRLDPPSPLRLKLLGQLPLSAEHRRQLAAIERAEALAAGGTRLAHLPMFLVTGRKKP